MLLFFFIALNQHTAISAVYSECENYTDCDMLIACELTYEIDKTFSGLAPDYEGAAARAIQYRDACKNTINNYLKNNSLPKNLNVVFSGWDENFKIDNPYCLPTTYVYFPKQSNNHIPEFAIPCKGECKHCKSCWSLKMWQSVYFHKH